MQEVEREVVEVQAPSPKVLETPKVPLRDPAAAKDWERSVPEPQKRNVERKTEAVKPLEPKLKEAKKVATPKPATPRAERSSQKVKQTNSNAPIQKVGQQVRLARVQVSDAPSQCAPCRIPGRLSDGRKVLLVSPNARLWNVAGVQGSVTVSIKGSVMRVSGAEAWILLQGVSP